MAQVVQPASVRREQALQMQSSANPEQVPYRLQEVLVQEVSLLALPQES